MFGGIKIFKTFSQDSRGFAFSMDLLIALIPITIIIGMAAVSMDDMSYRSQSVIQLSSLDRVATDSADALARSSGTPNDWEYDNNVEVPGLAKLDIKTNETEKNVLSFLKINALTKSDLDTLLGSNYDSCLVITDLKSNTVLKKLGEIKNNASDIVRVEKAAKTTKLDLATSLEGVLRNIDSPRTYTTQFSTTEKVRTYLNYWVLVKKSGDYNASIYVNDNLLMSSSEILEGTNVKEINDTLLINKDSGENIVKVVGTSGNGFLDVYVVSAPANVEKDEIDLEDVNPIDIKMELYVWVR